MARKVQLTKLLEQIRGFAEVSNRRPSAQPGMPLVWMGLRPQILQAHLPRRRLDVQIAPASEEQRPDPVKISFAVPSVSTSQPQSNPPGR